MRRKSCVFKAVQANMEPQYRNFTDIFYPEVSLYSRC